MPLDRRHSVFAKLWQLAILKKMYEENNRPSASQRREPIAETGLYVQIEYHLLIPINVGYRDDAWIKRWFRRQHRMSRARSNYVLNRPEKSEELPVHQTKLNLLSLLEDTVKPKSDEPRIPSPPPSHPTSSQGALKTNPKFDELLNAQPGEVDHVRVETPCILTLTPRRILPAVWSHSLGYIPGQTSHLSRELMQRPLPQYTSTWSYSRNPLHDRHPEFSELFSPATYDGSQYGARLPELAPRDSSPIMDNPSNVLRTDYTTRPPEHISAARQSPITSSVSLPASWLRFSRMHTPQAERTSDATQDLSSPSRV
ncbi:hypothetical protein M405DRAFT_921338 [Rhizopogon salebrosus TDB-379]|nr:hypothetical protein M405DRAFT_921338 [Rhizopogon salebrosus TDB-379]